MKKVSHGRKRYFLQISPPHVQYNFNKPEEVFFTKNPMSGLAEPDQITKENFLHKWHISPKNFLGTKLCSFNNPTGFHRYMFKKFFARSPTYSAQSPKPKEEFFSIEKIVNSLLLLLWTLKIQFYNLTTAAFPLTLANCISTEVRWILAQSQNIITKILFVCTTSFYLRKLPRDGRILFQQTRRNLFQQNSGNVQRFFFTKSPFPKE